MADDEWDRVRADRSVAEIERLEQERLENAKSAAGEARELIRRFVLSDVKILRQLRRHTGYLDTYGVAIDRPDEIDRSDLFAPWDDALNTIEQTNSPRQLHREIELTDREFRDEEERKPEDNDEANPVEEHVQMWWRAGPRRYPMWLTTSREYAQFYGSPIYSVQVAGNILDLSDVTDVDVPEDVELPVMRRTSSGEMYEWAEKAAKELQEMGYDGVIVWQWHADYGPEEEPQKTLLLFEAP